MSGAARSVRRVPHGMTAIETRRKSRRRGSVLIPTLGITLLCAGLAALMMRSAMVSKSECDASWMRDRCLCLARAGVANAYFQVQKGNSGSLGNAASPVAMDSGVYWVEAVSNADGTTTLTSHGIVGRQSVSVRAVVEDNYKPVFEHALYAGNSSNDPAYTMRFGGTGSQADDVSGDIYSGNDLAVTGTPTLTGSLRAKGTITGAAGSIGSVQPGPGPAAMNYQVNNDVNVSAAFASVTSRTSGQNGHDGDAYELPQSNPAHIFRKNPTDRATQTALTAKHDYFLEDPYEHTNAGGTMSANDATTIRLTNSGGNDVVYYIDGNFWLHSGSFHSVALRHGDAAGVHVTFAVKGNVYMMDNLVRADPAKDGVLLIALKDPAVADSGNIYFGDMLYGTLKQIDAFMYAENDFYDNNLNAGGTAAIVVNGVMSAGNQVAINRDFGTSHVKLDLNFDSRVTDHTLTLPGMPPLLGGSGSHSYVLAAQWGLGQ